GPGQFRVPARLLQSRHPQDLCAFVLRLLVRQLCGQIERRASVAELQVDLGALDLHSRVQVRQLGLPRHGVRKYDTVKRRTVPLRCGSLESSEGAEIVSGRSLGERGAGTELEVPRVDGFRGEVESLAAGRMDEDVVPQLSAQS